MWSTVQLDVGLADFSVKHQRVKSKGFERLYGIFCNYSILSFSKEAVIDDNIHKWSCAYDPRKLCLYTLKFELHINFTFHKIVFDSFECLSIKIFLACGP